MQTPSVTNTPEARTFFASMSERYGRNLSLRDVPLREFVDATPDLTRAKITDLVMRGYNRHAYWSQLVKVYTMIEPIETLRLTNSNNFRVVTGFNNTQANLLRNNKNSAVNLSCIEDEKEKRLRVTLDERDFVPERAADLEGEFIAIGESFSKTIRDEIIAAYLKNKTTQQARSGDTRYTAIQKLVKALNKTSNGMSAIIMHGDDFCTAITEETTGGNAPFAKALSPVSNIAIPFDSSRNKYDGLIGFLDGRVPVYVASDYNRSDLPTFAGVILGVAVDEGLVMGLHKDFKIDTEYVNLEKGSNLVNAYRSTLSMRYDLQAGNAAGIGYVSGA
jgi:hypothetical protein